MQGYVHSFQSLGTVDGPGVRCVVFLQGCPLRCVCCHNPDTWRMTDGTLTDVEELMKKILRCRMYFGPTGGVTLSGGEPLLQAEFARALFTRCKQEGLHTALDTSGCEWNPAVEALLQVTDLVLLDHKYATEEDYRAYTGGSLAVTEEFLARLNERNIPTWLRRVIIPGKNEDEASVRRLAALPRQYGCIQKIELLPFRDLCREKYETMGLPFPLEGTSTPTRERMEALKALIPPEYQ